MRMGVTTAPLKSPASRLNCHCVCKAFRRAQSSGSTMSDWLRADGAVSRPSYSYSAGSASSTPPSAGAGVSGADTIP